MSRYSKIFHHITVDDVKKKRQDNIVAEKIKLEEEKKEKEIKEYIDSVVEKTKSNWLQEMMTTAQVFSYTLPATGNTDHQTMQSGFDGESITALTSFTDIALVNDPHDMGTNIRNNDDPNLVPTNMDANHTANTTSSGLEGDSGGFRGINWTSTSTATMKINQ